MKPVIVYTVNTVNTVMKTNNMKVKITFSKNVLEGDLRMLNCFSSPQSKKQR